MKKNIVVRIFLLSISLGMIGGFSSCDDEPDSKYYYSFTGEMMSEYLQNRPEYSEFAEVVDRAGLMDLLSAYGHFTCFCPDNVAMEAYLAQKGTTLAELTKADCDTIARTHLVNMTYSTIEMVENQALAKLNMLNRPVSITYDLDEEGNSVVVLNKEARILFATQNDSVENGIVHPIDKVLPSTSNLLLKEISVNPNIGLYAEALVATGLSEKISKYRDDSYEDTGEIVRYRTGHGINECARIPEERKYGFTAFMVTDSVLKAKYGITTLEDLYNKACEIYDQVYPQDKGAAGHSFDNLTDSVNPLYRFMAYHILDRNVIDLGRLTVKGQGAAGTNYPDFGVITDTLNPTEWYTTMLPYKMMKVQHQTVKNSRSMWNAVEKEYYLNRRCDDQYLVEGVHVQPSTPGYKNGDGLNGIYFYVDDILKFDDEVQNTVFNCRMRMDFSTIFPEVMSNNMRMNGNMDADVADEVYDEDFINGYNYFFPDGYLSGVTVGGNGNFIYRRPRSGYYSMHGDEFICTQDYDIEFRLPPVPFESEWQIRLGYAPMDKSQGASRGVAQVYFDGKPQGIPLDMSRRLTHSSLLNMNNAGSLPDLRTMSIDKRTEEKKTLKNLGYYRGALGGYHTHDQNNRFANQPSTVRIVLCTVHMGPDEEHYLRVRSVSVEPQSEAMLDYLELVPKSVYGVVDEGVQEDDL